jgi:hypothetical protein
MKRYAARTGWTCRPIGTDLRAESLTDVSRAGDVINATVTGKLTLKE